MLSASVAALRMWKIKLQEAINIQARIGLGVVLVLRAIIIDSYLQDCYNFIDKLKLHCSG